jgi:hypothetical protein
LAASQPHYHSAFHSAVSSMWSILLQLFYSPAQVVPPLWTLTSSSGQKSSSFLRFLMSLYIPLLGHYHNLWLMTWGPCFLSCLYYSFCISLGQVLVWFVLVPQNL